MKGKEIRHLYTTFIGFGFNLIISIIFWNMLITQNTKIILNANALGEFWFEVYLVNGLLLISITFLVIHFIEYWRGD